MRDKKRVSMKRLHFPQKLLIIVICITLICVNTFGKLIANADVDKIGNEEIESADESSETANAKGEETKDTNAKESEAATEMTEAATEMTEATTEMTEATTEMTEAKKTETANEIEEETVSESKMVEETEDQIITRPASARNTKSREVGTWQEFIDALANPEVNAITLTADLKRTDMGKDSNPGPIARNLIIAGQNHSIDFGSGADADSTSILLGGVSTPTRLAFENVTFTKTSFPETAMFYSSSDTNGSNWNIQFTSGKTETNNAAGLIDAPRASLTFTAAGINSFSLSYNTSLFKVGSLTMIWADVTAVSSSTSSTSTPIYMFDVAGDFIMDGTASKLTVKSTEAPLFKVGGNFTAKKVTAETIGTGQTNNQFNVGGNFVVESGAMFETTTKSTSGSTSLYQIDVAGNFTMEKNTTLTANSIDKSLFKVGKDFTVGENATLTADSAATEQSNNQFDIGGNFVMKAGSKFTTTTATTDNTDDCYQIAAGGDFRVENNAVLIAESAGKSLFEIAGDFTVGESAEVTTKTTNGANRQFFVKNFTTKANSSIETTSDGATYQFYITGDFTMGSGGVKDTGSVLYATSSGESNSIIYMEGSGTIDLASYTKTYISNSGSCLDEGDNSPENSHGIYGEVGALNMQAHSLLTIQANAVGYRTMVTNSLKMVDGAAFYATGVHQSAIALTENYSNSNSMPATINIEGAGTQLNLNCFSEGKKDNLGATMIVAGTTDADEGSVFNLTNGAEIIGYSKSNTVLQMWSKGSVFTVKDDAKLYFIQNGEKNKDDATLLFSSIKGDQEFIIDNAEANIRKLGGSTEVIGFYNGDNSISVINGGKFYVYNAGDGSPDDKNNRGISYENGSSNEPDSFYVEGYGSVVNIIADNGSAISLDGTSTVQALSGSTLILEGTTKSDSTGGAIQSSGSVVFELDNPQYFDLRNNRSDGGRVLDSSGGGNEFILKKSDFSVWRKGINLNGDPTKSWILIDFVLNGNTFDEIYSTNFPSEFNTSTYEGSTAYSRMCANNVSAVIDELRVSTNADKSIYGHAYIPESIDTTRDACTGEVYVTVKVTNADNTFYYLEGTTVGVEDNGGLSVYGESARGGMFKILNDPEGDGTSEFLQSGQTVEVVSAYRSNSPSDVVGEDRVHHSTENDLIAPDVITVDVTPPTALKVTDLDEDIRIYKENLTTKTTVLSGTSEETGSKVYVYKNNLLWVSGEVEADGTWSITLPDILADGETIAIALNDNVPNADNLTSYDLAKLEDNGIFANNGNENPSGDYIFHDATFNTRLELGVVFHEALELLVSSEIEYGTHKISPGVTTYPAGIMELKVGDCRASRNEWILTAILEEPFTLTGGEDVLDIDLIYAYNNKETVIGSSEVHIWQHTNTSDIFDVYEQWTTLGNGNGLFVRASAGDIKIGSYTAVINWTLSDVP